MGRSDVFTDVSRRTLVTLAVAAAAAILTVGAVALASARSAEPSARQTVAAPIDGLDVRVMESNPPQYVLTVKAGLPGGCAKQDSHKIARAGDVITVTVLNSLPSGNPICTMIYGTYELNLSLGSDFRSGQTYTVHVNDKTTTFRAQ